jgi:hypothetical protein
MKRHRYSKASLRSTLLWCSAAVLACGLTAGFMNLWDARAAHQRELAAQGIHHARARIEQANAHRALIDQYKDRYASLLHEGLTVRFDRSVAGDWFDQAVRGVRSGVIGDYVIGKDIPYAGPETAQLAAFQVISHRLDFNATVADEDEFADLMGTIEKRVPGTTAQEACSLTRTLHSSDAEAELALHCSLVWYEFRSVAQPTVRMAADHE